MNIPAMDLAYAQLRLYYSETFPYLLLFPLQLGDLTQFIGLGLFTLFFLFKYNFKNKKIYIFIILFYFTIFSFFGQKTPRFYTEIYTPNPRPVHRGVGARASQGSWASWGFLVLPGASWDRLEASCGSWGLLGLPGPSWGFLEAS